MITISYLKLYDYLQDEKKNPTVKPTNHNFNSSFKNLF